MPYKFGQKEIYLFGEKESGRFQRFIKYPHTYEDITTRCLQKKILFEDVEFPATKESIGETGAIQEGKVDLDKVVWLRPKEILGDVGTPRFRGRDLEGHDVFLNRLDVKQGFLGDCWFLASLGNATLVPRLVEIMCPSDNTFNEDKYCGAFHFRFWNHGYWIDVAIDDRLPCIWNEKKQKHTLIFARYSDTFLFWVALAEKAYAKLYGSYNNIESGEPMEAMEDFTGGISEEFELTPDKLPADLFDILLWSKQRDGIIAAGTGEAEDIEDVGLVAGHAFSITGLKQFKLEDKLVRLFRVRNPWGGNIEWNGAWADRSAEWNALSVEDKKKFDLRFENDGEFWMEYSDFVKYFVKLQLCQLSPVTLDEDPDSENWYRINFQMKLGEFTKEQFDRASQHFVKVEHYSDNPNPTPEEEKLPCFMLIALMNRNIPLSSLCEKLNKPVPEFGFYVFRIDNAERNPGPFTPAYFRRLSAVGKQTDNGESKREIVFRYRLPAGTYCIIPFCADPNFQGEYVLRIISEKKATTSAAGTDANFNRAATKVISQLWEVVADYNEFKVELRDLFGELRDRVQVLETAMAAIQTNGLLLPAVRNSLPPPVDKDAVPIGVAPTQAGQ